MNFYVETPRGERDEARIRALHRSLNAPVIAIDELPVGPARAGIATFEAPGGAIRLQIAVRSLRAGEVLFFTTGEEIRDGRDAVTALEAALSFAEGMGFLFDEDEVAAFGARGVDEAVAMWRELVGAAPDPAREAEDAPTPDAEVAPPVLELVREVPGRGASRDSRRTEVAAGEEFVLSDIATVGEPAVAVISANGIPLSKFRLALVAGDSEMRGEGAARIGPPATAAASEPPDARIRLLSRF